MTTQKIAIAALVVSVIALLFGVFNKDVETVTERIVEQTFGGVTNLDSLTLSEDLVVGGSLDISEGVTADFGSITATTTLTSDSDNIQLLAASANMTTITLPTAEDGLHFKFVVAGALTGSSVLVDSAEGDNIEGNLFVNDAAVACSGEDQINIVTDGEVVGDYFEIVSDGTSWYIIESRGEAAAKMTCTDPS